MRVFPTAIVMVAGLALFGGVQTVRGQVSITLPSVLPVPYADPEGGAEFFQRLLVDEPDRLDWHLALTRELTATGVLAADADQRVAALERAADVAARALELDSLSADAHYWYAASRGLHADIAGGQDKITLAREAHLHATRALELDSLHGGANHILGRLHAGTKRLGFVTRMIGRMLGLGEIMDEASWESAERRMRVGAERVPDMLVHQVELGKLLVRIGNEQEGREILETVARRTPRHGLDAHYIAIALRELDAGS